MTRFSTALCGFALFVALPLAAQSAKPPIRDVPELSNAIFAIVTANEIRRKCDDIDGRIFRGIGEIRKVRARANELGYSDAEIRAVLDSDAEKALMIEKGRRYMASKGLDYDKPGDLCRLGHLEIQANSTIGVLLRAN